MTTLAALSPRHRQILALIAEGRSDREIAAATGLACQTVRHHARKIYAALGVQEKGNPRVAAAVKLISESRRLAT